MTEQTFQERNDLAGKALDEADALFGKPALGLCFHHEHCGVLPTQPCRAAAFRRPA